MRATAGGVFDISDAFKLIEKSFENVSLLLAKNNGFE